MAQFIIPRLKTTEALLLLYVVFIPLEALIIIKGMGTITRLIGYLLIIVFVLEYRINWRIVSKEAYLFITLLVLSSLWSKEVDGVQLLRIIMFFIIMFIVVHVLLRNSDFVIYLVNSYTVAAFLLAVTSFIGFLRVQERYASIEGMGVAPLSLYLVVALGFQLTIILRKVALFNILMSIGLILGIIASGTRASWLAVIALLTMFILRESQFQTVLKKAMIIFVMVFIVIAVFPPVNSFINSRTQALAYDQGANRTLIWKVGWELWKDKPMFGFGYRNFPVNFTFENIGRAELSKSEYNRLTLGGTYAHRGSHSDYLSIAVELGLFGLTLFLLWIRRLLNNFKYLSVYHMSFLAILIMAMFQDNINNKIFWVVFGIMEAFRIPPSTDINYQ